MKRVEGKVVIITGASLGIGKAAAERLAEEGAIVAVTDILEAEGQALAGEIAKAGYPSRFWGLDVSSEDNVRRVMTEVAEAFGRIDVLVNNAGIGGVSKPTHEVTSEEWDRVMNINVKGVFYCTKHVIPHMQKAGGGSIINLSSIYGIVSAMDAPPYHASKGAVRLMSKTDALFYAHDRIRVNSIHPGFIWTPMIETAGAGYPGGVEGFRNYLVSKHPIGHLGEPDDIAWGIVYLASDEARFITGTELVIDGGYTAQ